MAMIIRSSTQRLVEAVALMWLVAAIGQAQPAATRPALAVSAPDRGCPRVEGAFAVVLDPARGMLVLSSDWFPAGHRAGTAAGQALTVDLPGRDPWPVDLVGSAAGAPPVWAGVYPFRTRKGDGCVAFDKQRFSSEGDLATYLGWLVEEVYLELPAREREQFPALELSDRQVTLLVEQEGFRPLRLVGKEGSTLAMRVPGGAETLLLIPFVLDEATARLAVKVSVTDQPYWQSAPKRPLGFVVVTTSEAATLEGRPQRLRAEAVTKPAQNP